MKVSTALLTALAMPLCLVGCGHIELDATAVTAYRANQQERYEPVYVMPNCQNLGGKMNCQWLEPRSYQQQAPSPAPAAANGQRVPGIAI